MVTCLHVVETTVHDQSFFMEFAFVCSEQK